MALSSELDSVRLWSCTPLWIRPLMFRNWALMSTLFWAMMLPGVTPDGTIPAFWWVTAGEPGVVRKGAPVPSGGFS
ncbi:MAG: hypothetical protein FD127_4238 [Acidimicrobiaceae bacterium]|nr:MAG: hypothetical protein FD127_4238 [Acidimicrobiaceae bacterium]